MHTVGYFTKNTLYRQDALPKMKQVNRQLSDTKSVDFVIRNKIIRSDLKDDTNNNV